MLAAELPPQQQDEYVAGDKCRPLKKSDVSHNEGAHVQRWRENYRSCIPERKSKRKLMKMNNLLCWIISHMAK